MVAYRWMVAAVFAAGVAQPLAAQGKIELPVSLAELQKRVKADSNDPAAHYNVALAYWSAKQWPEVDRELRSAVALEPRFAAAHLALAYLPEARNQHLFDGIDRNTKELPKDVSAAMHQREIEYRHAFLIDPLVDMRIMAANDRSPEYWSMRDYFGEDFAAYIKGLTDCEEGHYADCENNLQIFIQAYGNSAHAKDIIPSTTYFFHGIAAAHNQHFDVAIRDFTQLIERDSIAVKKAEEKNLVHFPLRTNEYRYFIGVFQQAAGQLSAATATFQSALEKDLSLYIAHVRLAEIYEAQKNLPQAIAERRNAVNANPDDATLQVDLGVTLGKAGLFNEAHDALQTATERLPRNTDAWFWLGIADQQLGRTAQAKADYAKVIAVAPSRMEARVTAAKQRMAALP